MLKKSKKEDVKVEVKPEVKPVEVKPVEEVKEVKVKSQPLKSKLLVGDIEEFNITAKQCIELQSVEYEVHVIIQDALKKINNCKKDHGY